MLELVDKSKLINVKIYYQIKKINNIEQLVVMKDEVEKLIEANKNTLEGKEEKEEDIKDKLDIKTLETKWSLLNWQDKNDILEQSYSVADPVTGMTQFGFFKYRQVVVQKALKSWNIESVDNSGNKYSVPVNPQNISNLNSTLGLALYEKYNSLTNYTDLALGNL